jgi:hypothetical protein
MTNTQHLNNLLESIAEITGEATNREQAKERGHERYLYIESASAYGGYRLVNVGVNNGAHYGAFGGNGIEARLKYKEMVIKLEGILAGLNSLRTIINKTQNV